MASCQRDATKLLREICSLSYEENLRDLKFPLSVTERERGKLGYSWRAIRGQCFPSNPDCTEYWFPSTLTSDLYIGPTNVTIKLPYKHGGPELMRLRFMQRDGYRQQHSWALSHVYVGDECQNLCFGRGFCDAGVCSCNSGWTGSSCELVEEPLPTFIVADFTGENDPSHWRKLVGAQITSHCGPITSGQALHFTGACTRYLETVDLDLREALYVQFDLRTGCLDSVSGREAGGDKTILVQTSCDTGISWHSIKKILLIYHQPTYVWIELPANARCLGGRVRWWQPEGGERNRYDWAIDSVVIGGHFTPPDNVTYARPHQLVPPLWLRNYNSHVGRYCGNLYNMHVMMSTASEPAVIQTTDIQVTKKHSINFLLAFGCGAEWDSKAEPIRLEYSVDFGNRWQLVREMCLPGNISCSEMFDASVFYAPLNWNRYVYPLDLIGPAKYMRFRWVQNPSADVSGSHQWSLRDVYIGISCPYHCMGRGSCQNAICQCEAGYVGEYCQHVLRDNIAYIRDEFTLNEFKPHFAQVQGGLLSEGCGDLEEPPTATFQGPYTRMLRTVPVDTRNSRFVHFTAQIGSIHGNNICRSASHRLHNVFLQYSMDGGTFL
ncbi:hypothetical protein SK128_005960 [Halocaridina rubra]|uniref:Reelin n=1 Tax=Halocaridina rubra TaxID=373956 RepID=A0AAN8WP39_HALRR